MLLTIGLIGTTTVLSVFFVLISTVLEKERTLEKGEIYVLSKDLAKTEFLSDTLDIMAENMLDGTVYRYMIGEPMSDELRRKIIIKLKSEILLRHPHIDTKSQMEFYDLSKWEQPPELLSAFQNLICMKANEQNEFYILLPDDGSPTGCIFVKLTQTLAAEYEAILEKHREQLAKCRIQYDDAA
jgi:hypothetical protein